MVKQIFQQNKVGPYLKCNELWSWGCAIVNNKVGVYAMLVMTIYTTDNTWTQPLSILQSGEPVTDNKKHHVHVLEIYCMSVNCIHR